MSNMFRHCCDVADVMSHCHCCVWRVFSRNTALQSHKAVAVDGLATLSMHS